MFRALSHFMWILWFFSGIQIQILNGANLVQSPFKLHYSFTAQNNRYVELEINASGDRLNSASKLFQAFLFWRNVGFNFIWTRKNCASFFFRFKRIKESAICDCKLRNACVCVCLFRGCNSDMRIKWNVKLHEKCIVQLNKTVILSFVNVKHGRFIVCASARCAVVIIVTVAVAISLSLSRTNCEIASKWDRISTR